jgi:hypothetical protein
VAQTTLAAGRYKFQVQNTGSDVTEVYIYGKGDKVITEKENIGPGTTATFTATMPAGDYEVACKPGQKGDGIRTRVTVTGGAASSSSGSDSDGGYDREVELSTDGRTLTGVPSGARLGEKIEFKLENKTTGKCELEIIDPSGKIVAEIEADPSGAAETVVTLATAGTWTLKIEGQGVAEVEKKLVVS